MSSSPDNLDPVAAPSIKRLDCRVEVVVPRRILRYPGAEYDEWRASSVELRDRFRNKVFPISGTASLPDIIV